LPVVLPHGYEQVHSTIKMSLEMAMKDFHATGAGKLRWGSSVLARMEKY
jgi:hypothetical protein